MNKIIEEDVKNIVKNLGDSVKDFNGKTILITGGAGFLGKYLVYTLDYLNRNTLDNPCKIIVLDNFITGSKGAFENIENLEMINLDISKNFEIKEDVHYIMHAASIAAPLFYNKYRLETIDVGFLGTKNILEIAKEKKVKSFLFFSTSEVYGNPDPKFIPTPETYFGNVSFTGPRAVYDEPKRIAETLCMTYADIYSLPVKIVRPFNVYGPGMRLDDGRGAINFIVSALRGKKIPVYGDGKNTRSWTYVSDATTGFFKVLLSSHNREAFNVGSDEHEIEMRHLAQIVAGLVRQENVEVSHVESPNETYGKADVNRRAPDLTKIRTMLGYTLKVNLVEGLNRLIKWTEEELKKQNLSQDNQKSESFGKIEKNGETNCTLCGNPLTIFLDLGEQPLANKYPTIEQFKNEQKYPLQVCFCQKCKNVQLSYKIPRDIMFEDYYYLSSVNQGLVEYFKGLANELVGSDFVVDIGSNDGILLKPLKELGIKCVGVDPSINVSKIANSQGLTTITSFFNSSCVDQIIKEYGKPDAVVCSSTFTHLENPHEFIKNLKNLMREDGKFILEVEYIGNFIKNIQFERFYLDRIFYYSVSSLQSLFKKYSFDVTDVEEIEPHGGSLKVIIHPSSQNKVPTERLKKWLEKEKEELNLHSLLGFRKIVDENIQAFYNKLIEYKKRDLKVCGYGSPARVSTICNYGKIDGNLIKFTVDDSPLKQNRFTPGTHIPIVSKGKLKEYDPDIIVMFAYEYFEDIKKKLNKDYKFLMPIPPVEI